MFVREIRVGVRKREFCVCVSERRLSGWGVEAGVVGVCVCERETEETVVGVV